MTLRIDRESPLGADLEPLFARHTAEMHAESPPESIHMLPAAGLAGDDIAFVVIRDAGRPVAMGALKDLGHAQGELKSMHVLTEYRRRGLSRMLLSHLTDHARARGFARLSLETGTQPGFLAARGLYARAGFTECPPFGSYRTDPNSVFMTLLL